MSADFGVIPEIPVDAAALGRVAEELRAKAALLPEAGSAVVSRWDGLEAVYEAPEAAAVAAKMRPLAVVAADVGEALLRAADIVDRLSDDLLWLALRRRGLVEHVAEFARAARGIDDRDRSVELTREIDGFAADVDERIDQARGDLAAIPLPPTWEVAIPDAAVPPLGPRLTWAVRSEEIATELVTAPLLALARSGTSRVARLVAAHPEWADLLREHPPAPDAVRTWWDSLSPAAAAALIDGAPALVGALGGVPPLARVAANRVTARSRLGEVEAELAAWERLRGEGASADLQADRRAAWEDLLAERDYLAQVVRGDVSLVLYQPDANRLVEMIGTPGTGTQRVLTYVPGTFTSVDSFYRGEPQKIARWLVGQDDGMLAFVWKGTEFPGDDESQVASEQLRGIGEANDQVRAHPAGVDLARFVADVRSDSEIAQARQIACGYSWGLVPVTSSEVVGVRYDAVHSLAGAWMADGWSPRLATDYTHWSYTDFLSMAQDAGWVGEGRNPDATPAFESHLYERPSDMVVPLGGDLAPFLDPEGPSVRISLSPFQNHQLIVDTSQENAPVLNSLLREMLR
ncbi:MULTISPECIES: hypothetical protein [Microbacterium]|uniref:hypothetical protein n=1 Tax=Microbacterium TaxID=33882 RepID=UPI0027887DC6|nr:MULTISPECIES: hypothetical protein [Microbacterium]MDQ1076540.1 hypothetical protein [Microbacterium sp. SORGH_AS_0969]MDQ1116775.1 hypothetical protein [Microbacterium testaceum]